MTTRRRSSRRTTSLDRRRCRRRCPCLGGVVPEIRAGSGAGGGCCHGCRCYRSSGTLPAGTTTTTTTFPNGNPALSKCRWPARQSWTQIAWAWAVPKSRRARAKTRWFWNTPHWSASSSSNASCSNATANSHRTWNPRRPATRDGIRVPEKGNGSVAVRARPSGNGEWFPRFHHPLGSVPWTTPGTRRSGAASWRCCCCCCCSCR
mmetsp:Transcript_3625/g.8756  ORF Transcript_3625/g.8756 Transcript_3625/m.8756 type:complete len:205 (+) Transcript_3625:315-929(+)